MPRTLPALSLSCLVLVGVATAPPAAPPAPGRHPVAAAYDDLTAARMAVRAARTPAERAAARTALLGAELRNAGYRGPAPQARAAADTSSSVLTSVGDFDGDGRADVVEATTTVTGTSARSLVRAVRGYDARPLWEATREGYSYLIAAPVGPTGSPGVVVFDVTQTGMEQGGVLAVAEIRSIAAYDRAGVLVWERRAADAWSFLPAGMVLLGSPRLLDVANVLPGPASDVVLGVGLGGFSLAYEEATVVYVVDGATGDVHAVPVADVIGDAPVASYPRSVGDISGDGLGDLVVTTEDPRGNSAMTAIRVVDRTVLWHVATGRNPWGRLVPVGDATADGRADLALEDYDSARFALHSGLDGTVVWARPGGFPTALGDADGDGRADVAAGLPGESSRVVSVQVFGYSSDGSTLYERTHTMAHRFRGDVDTWATLVDVGDVHGDGTRDLGLVLHGVPESGPARNGDLVLDGRTGRRLWAPGRLPERGFAAADGRGADFVDIAPARGGTTVAVRRGTTGQVLWTVWVPVETAGIGSPIGAPQSSVGLVDLDGDRCADLVWFVATEELTGGVVVRGRDGRPLWSYRFDGRGRGALKATRVGPDRNPAC